ncbi:MAG TPA: hypothetical protein VF407_08275 [Polyangiaceae bacterium]
MKRTAASLLILLGSLAAACDVSTSDAGSSHDKVTDIPSSSVLDQGETGNCWLYATAAWSESLHASATGDTRIHFSPTYWDYWDWYDQIMAGSTNVAFGGYWGRAVELVRRYGLAPLGSLGGTDDAALAVSANAKINQALANGTLQADDGGAMDPVKVLAALNNAFDLSDDNVALLQKTFGPDGKHTFADGAEANGFLVRPQDFDVTAFSASGKSKAKLSDVIGEPVNDDMDQRSGSLAWTAAYAPSTAGGTGFAIARPLPGQSARKAHALVGDEDAGTSDDAGALDSDAGTASTIPAADPAAWKDYTRRIQRALNDGAPLPIAWLVVFPDADFAGHFRPTVASTTSDQAGWHETLITDYEVTNVPGFGTLQAGQVATDAQKAAALEDPSTVTFLRVKNSWGTAPVTGWAEPLAGYNDLDVSYLSGTVQLCDSSNNCYYAAPSMFDAVLPPGY